MTTAKGTSDATSARASGAGQNPEGPFDVEAIRAQFPTLHQTVHGRPLVYLDTAATALKPQAVLDAMVEGYTLYSANIHRGVHWLSAQATQAFEGAREKLQRFLNAKESAEIIFVRGTTEGINLVASSYARPLLAPDDEILITGLEHHSNIVPWQLVAGEKGAKLKVVPVEDNGEVSVERFAAALSSRTKLVSLAHVSNTLGTVLEVKEMARLAHEVGAKVLLDGAQAAPHLPVDVQDLDCDFYAMSGHKLYGPTGIGVLYGRRALLEAMPPYQGGGDMIASVTFERTTYNELPWKFEAGTPHIVGAIALGAATDWLSGFAVEKRLRHDRELIACAAELLGKIAGLTLVGTAPGRVGSASFVIEGIHPHDLGTVADREGVAIRTGHHCTQPLMDRLGIPATARASFGIYSTPAEIEVLARALHKARALFHG